MSKGSNNVFKITMQANTAKETIGLKFTPPCGTSRDVSKTLLQVLMSGSRIALHSILADLPVLRPATDKERDAKVYVFKDVEKDTQLFKLRKQLYLELAQDFEKMLNDVFPDVQYIMAANTYQQDVTTEMSREEAEAHLKSVQEVAEYVRNVKEEFADPSKQ